MREFKSHTVRHYLTNNLGNLVKRVVNLQGFEVGRFGYCKDTFNDSILCNSNIVQEVRNSQRQFKVLNIYAYKNIVLLVAVIDAFCERIILYTGVGVHLVNARNPK